MPVDRNYAQQLIQPEHGDRDDCPRGGLDLPSPIRVVGVGVDVMNVICALLESSPRCGASAPGALRMLRDEGHELGGYVVCRNDSKKLAVETENQRAFSLTQPACVLRQLVDDGLEIDGGAPNHLEKLTGYRLLFQGFSQLALASLLRLEQPRVLDGDDGLVRKGIDELDLAFGERAHFGAPYQDHPNCLTCVDQRDGERGAITELERPLPALGVFITFGQDVCDVNRSPFDDGTSCNEPTNNGPGELSNRAGHRNLPMVRDEVLTIAKHLKDRGVIRIAQARRGLDECIEHFLHVEGRAADDLQNIRGGGLLLQGFAKFVEESRVLDGYDGLVSKALNQLDLFVCKGTHLLSVNSHGSYGLRLPQHRHNEHRTNAKSPSCGEIGIVDLGNDIADVDDATVKYRSRGHAAMIEPHRPLLVERIKALRCHVVVSTEVHQCAVKAKHHGVSCFAKADCVTSYRVEDRLHIGR